MTLLIRRYLESDWPDLWPLLRATFETGDTYAFSPQSSATDIHAAWVAAPRATYVACDGDGPGARVLGSYFIKPNQPGLGSHVCNVSVLARHLEAAGVDGEDGVHQQMRWTPWNTSSAHHGGRTVRN